MERETRFVPVDGIETRAGEGGEVRGISGTAALFNRSTVIAGMWEERIAPGAFDDALKDGDVRALFNHDPNYPLGRTSAKTLTLEAKKDGLHYEVPDLPKSRADVLEAIQRGDVTGNSFSFSIERDADEEWEDRSKDGKLPLRTIKRIGKLYDVGPVTFPAYEDTKVAARCEKRAKELAEPKPEPVPADVESERERLRLAEAEGA